MMLTRRQHDAVFKRQSMKLMLDGEKDISQPRLNVITCGTSILTNKSSTEERNFLFANANKKEEEYSSKERAYFDNIVSHRRESILGENDEKVCKKLSAELNGFITYYRDRDKNNFDNARTDTHFLVCTDTLQEKRRQNLLPSGEKRAASS